MKILIPLSLKLVFLVILISSCSLLTKADEDDHKTDNVSSSAEVTNDEILKIINEPIIDNVITDDDVNDDEIKTDDVKDDDIKIDDVKDDAIKTDDVKDDDINTDDIKEDNVKTVDVKDDNVKADNNVKDDNIKTDGDVDDNNDDDDDGIVIVQDDDSENHVEIAQQALKEALELKKMSTNADNIDEVMNKIVNIVATINKIRHVPKDEL